MSRKQLEAAGFVAAPLPSPFPHVRKYGLVRTTEFEEDSRTKIRIETGVLTEIGGESYLSLNANSVLV
jgi:hypothetical protein